MKLSFKSEGEIKCFPDTEKLREFTTPRPALQEIEGCPALEVNIMKTHGTARFTNRAGGIIIQSTE